MRKGIIILLGLILSNHCIGQIKKGDLLFSIEGNYINSPTEIGVTTDLLQVSSKKTNLTGVVEYFITDNFSLGFGLTYHKQNEERLNENYLLNQYVQMEQLEIKKIAILPQLSASYYKKIIDKFYFGTSLDLAYGKMNQEYETFVFYSQNYATTTLLLTESNDTLIPYQRQSSSSNKIAFASLSPGIHYFINGTVGVNLQLGAIEYSIVDWTSEQDSFGLNFSPNYWALGVNLTF
jgi:hypothetical protein